MASAGGGPATIGGGGGGGLGDGGSSGSHASPTATHVLASSVAIASRSSLSKLQSRLSEMAMQIAPLVQRDVFCSRSDEEDEQRKVDEQDARFGPVRKARIQSRLTLRFEDHAIDMRTLAKPAGKGPSFTDVYNLTCVPLYAGEVQAPLAQKRGAGGGKVALPDRLDVGADLWQQVIQSIGWTVRRNLIRIGTRFVVRAENACRVEALLFQLYSLDEEQKTIQLISPTTVLQVTATLPLIVRTKSKEEYSRDASQLYKRAQAEIASMQEVLQGIVQLRKEEE